MIKKLLASSFFLGFLLTSPTAQASYLDITEDSPYKEGVDFFELVGALDSAEYFFPDRLVQKAEFYKILFRIFGESPQDTNTSFSDVPEGAWFTPFASLAEANGLEDGTLFEPAKELTRIEVLEKLLSAYGVTGGIVLWQDRTDLFEDVPLMHPDYSIIHQAVELGILEADLGAKFRPFQKLNRGELSLLMYTVEEWDLQRKTEAQNDFYKSDIFGSIWNSIVNEFYLSEGQSIDQDALLSAAVKGMLNSLEDPFSTYFSPQEATEYGDSLDGTFEGIGAYLEQGADGYAYFTGFIADSPASESGLEIGDVIKKVDGVDMTGFSIESVISRIKGPAGTHVSIIVEREGEELTFDLLRAEVTVNFVKGEIYQNNAWFFSINRFGGGVGLEFWETSKELAETLEAPEYIVIDVRGNGGGYLQGANEVMGLFVPFATKLVHLDYGDFEQSIVNGDTGPYYGIPLYILVDENTASASEIMAQTLREKNSALVIGTQTYGKGSVQTFFNYWDGSELKLTIAHWLSSDRTSIHGVGVTPDILIDPTLETESFDPWLEELEEQVD